MGLQCPSALQTPQGQGVSQQVSSAQKPPTKQSAAEVHRSPTELSRSVLAKEEKYRPPATRTCPLGKTVAV
jgi:hypothetical protein